MNKILVPVDFSEYSEYALEVAASLAKKKNAEIIVLHMMGLSEAVLTKDDSQEFMEAQYYMKLAKKRFDMFFNRPWLKDIKLTQMVQNYKVFREINNVAKEKDIDLIVMGSHGTGGLSEIFVGSNTEKVVRTSEVPVLVIKKRIQGFKIQKVVFGFDFQIENVPAYHKAIKLFRSLKGDVHLVHVNLPGISFMSTSEIQEEINKFLRVAHHGDLPNNVNVHQISDYSVETGLYHYAKKVDADLIAIPTHGRSGLAHFFKGSIGEDITNHVNLPVMTFRIQT